MLAFLAILSYGIWWAYTLQKPLPGGGCGKSGWLWNESCLYINEVKPDPALVSPKGLSPVLIGFTKAAGAGPPIFLPMWYRFRYVNVLTGGYSEFSDWTKSPVMSGACCLPCDGVCPFATGSTTCTYNQPVIGIDKTKIKYNPQVQQEKGEFIYMNLHRYVGKIGDKTPPTDAKDEIVGMMIMPRRKYYAYIDVLDNPCKKGCQVPDLCSSNPCDNTKPCP